eukprot:scaffold118965_cov36-Phaeocystis_antarctica.AAC.1
MSLSWALVATQGHELGSSHQLMSTHPIHDGACPRSWIRKGPHIAPLAAESTASVNPGRGSNMNIIIANE